MKEQEGKAKRSKVTCLRSGIQPQFSHLWSFQVGKASSKVPLSSKSLGGYMMQTGFMPNFIHFGRHQSSFKVYDEDSEHFGVSANCTCARLSSVTKRQLHSHWRVLHYEGTERALLWPSIRMRWVGKLGHYSKCKSNFPNASECTKKPLKMGD